MTNTPDIQNGNPNEMRIHLTRDEFGTYSYEFKMNGVWHECHDFDSKNIALEAAMDHADCVANGVAIEVVSGLGAARII